MGRHGLLVMLAILLLTLNDLCLTQNTEEMTTERLSDVTSANDDTTRIQTTRQSLSANDDTTRIQTTRQSLSANDDTTRIQTTRQSLSANDDTTRIQTTRQSLSANDDTTRIQTTRQSLSANDDTTRIQTTRQSLSANDDTTRIQTTWQSLSANDDTTRIQTTRQSSSPDQPPGSSLAQPTQVSTQKAEESQTTQNAASTDTHRTTVVDQQTTPAALPTTESKTTSQPSPCPSVCICSPVENGTKVDCSERGLHGIPDGLPSSTTILWLNNNNIQILPERAFINVARLEYLDLSSSNIQYLAAGAFDRLSNVRVIDLSKNSIDSVTHALDGLNSLENLNLAENQLETLPNDVFNSLSSLQVLTLNGNRISTITPSTFDPTPQLRKLYLSNNQLTDLKEHMFKNLVNLVQLELDWNEISTIPALVFESLHSLESLYLNYMSISTITDAAFNGLANLLTLSLSGNRLNSLSESALIPLTNLTTLILNSNPWRCDCKMKELYDYLDNHASINFQPQSIVCHSPPHISSMPITEVKVRSFACQPFITQVPHDKQVGLGDHVEFTCSVLGDPEPDIYWRAPQGKFDSSNKEGRVYVSAIVGSTKLIIENVETGDDGTYTCVANNSRGMSEDGAVLIVQVPPPTSNPVTCAPVNQPVQCIQPDLSVQTSTIRDTLIEIVWSPTYDSQTTGHSITVTKFGFTSPVKETNVTATSDSLYTITGLEPLTHYIVCVTEQVRDCHADTAFRNCIPVTTTGQAPVTCVNTPLTVAVDNVTETGLVMKWVSTDNQNAVGYIVQINEFGVDEGVLKITDLSVNSYKFVDLKANTNYVVCVTVYFAAIPVPVSPPLTNANK
ncbi:leucine-rich repeat-containing protein 4-like isoform X2 [Ptychodera flava]